MAATSRDPRRVHPEREQRAGFSLALFADRPEHSVFNVKAERRRVGELVAELPGLFPDLAIEVTTAGGGGPLLANDRLRGELGFEPRFTLESGLDANLADVRRREAASA